MKRRVRLTEGDLHNIVKESVKRILKETPLNYDIDNFSGRWYKGEPSEEEMELTDLYHNGDQLGDPFHSPNSFDDDEWIDGDKDMENDYSWYLFNRKPIANGVSDFYKVGRGAVPREVNDAQSMRNNKKDWSEKELRNGKRMMNNWVKGKRNLDDIGDAWDDIHY